MLEEKRRDEPHEGGRQRGGESVPGIETLERRRTRPPGVTGRLGK